MKVNIKADFGEALFANIELDYPKKIEVIIDVEIPRSLTPVPDDTIRFWVTSQPEGDYNKIIKDNPDCYSYLFTSFSDLLKLPKSRFFMACTAFFEPDPDMKKKFGVSTVMSGRCNLPGHFLRRELWQRKNEINIPLDFYLGTRNPLPKHFYSEGGIKLPSEHKEKKRVFDCMFHIAIDSYSRDNCFSEKLIDCFITKTVCVYWGCSNVDKFFNPSGIIQVNSVDDIIYACNGLTPARYSMMRNAIEDNYQRGLEYWNYGDYLEKKIKEVLSELFQHKITENE